MEPMSLLLIAGGAGLGWYKVLGTSRRRPLSPVWFAVALAIAFGLSFMPAAATQNLSYNWLFGVGSGAYARAVRITGRWDVWRPATRRSSGSDTAAEASSPRSPSSARRAVIRWAWRLLRREWRQHLVVLALIAAAVGGTVIGSAVAMDASPPAAAGFGSANRLVQLDGSDPRSAAEIAALRSRFGALDVIENQGIDTGLTQGAQLRAQNPDGAYGAPMLALVSGRYPSGAGQVAVTANLASTLGLRLGGVWRQTGHALSVVGIVENPQNLADAFVLVAPGQLGKPDMVTVLFDASSAQLAEPLPYGMRVQSPQPASGIAAAAPALIVLCVAVLALVFTGLVAVAGFAVLARRRQRALGMLAAIGATERDVQLVIMADGAIVGALGAILGALLGLAAWIWYAPRFSVSAGHAVPWTAVPWWLVACTMLLAVATATIAAWRPARAVARMPIVAALRDRPTPPAAAYRSATPALILLIAAPVLLATSGGWGGHGGRDALFQLGGLLLSALGLASAAPFVMARLAGPARHVPPAARLALRDLSRYRARSAAALAAGSLAVLIAMLVTLITTGRYSDPVDYFGPNLPSNEFVVYAPGDGPGTGRGPSGGGSNQDTAKLQQDADAIAADLGAQSVLALQPVEADLMHKTLQKTTGDSGSLYVATPALLARYGIDPASIDPGTMLITSRPGLAGLSGLFLLYGDFTDPNGQTYSADAPSVQYLAALPTGTDEPNVLVTQYAVRKLNLTVEPTSGWLIQAPNALTATQIDAARKAALAAGMTVATRSEAPSLAQVRTDATITGILIALGVLAMMIGLIRAESSDDLRILAATGASGRTRRAITATTAGTLALLAAVGGTLIAYVDTAAFFGSEFIERMSQVPGTDLLLVLVGLPAAAACGGWLLAGGEPARLSRVRLE